jgi:4-carboxymuconolactone decarboxylase
MDELARDGERIRREVLGDAYVDGATRDGDELMTMFNDLSHRFCWGTVWARPGLSWKVRSMLCLAMTTALNQPHAVRLHVRSALRNGCTRQEIGEVLLQAAVYCGMGAANSSFHVAKEVFAEEDRKAT